MKSPKDIVHISMQKSASELTSEASLIVYYSDEFPENIYKEKHPNFTDQEMEYVKKNYRNPVKGLFGDALDVVKTIYNNENFRLTTENEELKTDIQEFEIFDFFKNVYTDGVIIDPNSVLTYNIKESELIITPDGRIAQNERLPIYPYLVSIEKQIYLDKETFAYTIKGDYRYNFVLLNYINGKLNYSQYNFDSIKEKEEIQPTFTIDFVGVEGKFWRKGDGIKKIKDNELVIESYFAKAVPTMDDIIYNCIERSNVESRFSFPTRWYFAENCDVCDNGEVIEIDEKGDACSVQCKKCQGTSKKQNFSVFRDYQIPMPRQGFDSNSALPTPPAGYIAPTQEPQRYLTERIEKAMDKVFAWLGIQNSNTDVKGSETALSRMIDREEKYTALDTYLKDFGVTIEWWIGGYTQLRYYRENIEFSIQLYSNFKTTSSAEINEMFTALQKDNAPLNVLRPLLREYYDSIHEPEKFDIVDKYYNYKSDEMTRNLYAASLISAESAVISRNIMKWTDVIDMTKDIDAQLAELASKELGRPILQDFNQVIQTPIE